MVVEAPLSFPLHQIHITINGAHLWRFGYLEFNKIKKSWTFYFDPILGVINSFKKD